MMTGLRGSSRQGSLANERGQMSLAIVISAFIMVSLVAVFELVRDSKRQSLIAESRVERAQIETRMKASLTRMSVCNCLLRETNPVDGARIKVDSIATAPPDIDLTELRSGCDFSSDLNRIVRAGVSAGDRLTVSSIRLSNIAKNTASNIYRAHVTVELESKAVQLRPIRLPVSFAISNSAGTPDARPIVACVDPRTNPRTSCPTGFTMIGDPGIRDTFCIETDERPATNWMAAVGNCGTLGYSEGRAQLSTVMHWYRACKAMAPPNQMTNNSEWMSDGTVSHWTGDNSISENHKAVLYGNGACESFEQKAISVSDVASYRCVIY